MLDAKLYGEIGKEFARHKIEDEVEDILLELAEAIEDREKPGEVQVVKRKAGHGMLSAEGVCEEDGGVLIKSLDVSGKKFVIEDYIL